MSKVLIDRNGFRIRALECKKCGKYIYHPADAEEYKKFQELKQTPFESKLRIVGHSHVISIPKEILDFMQEQERMHDEMVRIFFEGSRRIVLSFGKPKEKEKEIEGEEK
jgi:hypothetical protein